MDLSPAHNQSCLPELLMLDQPQLEVLPLPTVLWLLQLPMTHSAMHAKVPSILGSYFLNWPTIGLKLGLSGHL